MASCINNRILFSSTQYITRNNNGLRTIPYLRSRFLNHNNNYNGAKTNFDIRFDFNDFYNLALTS